MNAEKKEPLFRISKRGAIPWWASFGIRLIGMLIALILCALIIFGITKLNPLKVYAAMWDGALGTNRRTWVTIRDTMMMLCIGLGLAPAFKMKFWNIGAEGQVLVGGIAAAACMLYLPKTIPNWLALVIMCCASALAGAVWGFFPGFCKAMINTNETLFTLMMNYIAIRLTAFYVAKWENPYGSNTVGIINSQSRFGWFPKVFDQQYGLNVILVLVLTIFIFIYLKYTKHGFEIAVVGDSENTARYCAMDVKKVIIRTMMLSGAICGIAGFLAVAGAGHTISTDTAGGRGFTTIIVAWMSKFNSFIMAAVSAFLVFLEKGAMQIASQYQLSDYISNVVKGIILIFLLGSEFFVNFKVRLRGSHKKEVTK